MLDKVQRDIVSFGEVYQKKNSATYSALRIARGLQLIVAALGQEHGACAPLKMDNSPMLGDKEKT